MILLLFVNNISAQWTSGYVLHFRHLKSVQMLDYNTIILVGGNENNDEISTIYRSVNGGETWNVISEDFSPWLISVKSINMTDAVAVGWHGNVKKSVDRGETWQDIALPENAANRSYNSVFFVDENIGFAAGGNQSNDSIQTIIKTTDGGNSWSLVYEELGYWLKSIYFVNENIGFAVGENGVLLKTLDGGVAWDEITLPSNISQINFNDVYFVDENIGWIVGGNKSNDSISTIAKTTNGGQDWEILIDELGGELNKIEFASPTLMLTVGDKSKIFRSSDGGNSFIEYVIPLEYDDYYDLYSLHFLNNHAGIIVGEWGIVYKYFNSESDDLPLAPSVETLNVDVLSSSSVMLKAKVNSQNSETNISFEYGISESLGNSIDANPYVLEEDNEVIATATLSDLTPGIYYYRVKANNSGGQNYGEIKQFYVGENPIPNFDFEEWTEYTVHKPKQWHINGNVSKVESYDGTSAVQMGPYVESDNPILNDDVSYISLGDFDDLGSEYIYMFSHRPDSIVAHVNYDLDDNCPSMLLYALLSEDREFIAENQFIISGTSNNVFERLAYKIDYLTEGIPYQALIVLGTTMMFDTIACPNNKIIVDNISYVGIDEDIPNANFEEWEDYSFYELDNWEIDNNYGLNYVGKPTSDAQSGEFAVEIENTFEERKNVRIFAIKYGEYGEPTFPVYAKHASLNGYYKFSPIGIDTLIVNVFLFKNGEQIAYGYDFITEATSEYKEIYASINYDNVNLVPDSAALWIELYGDPGSKAIIDNLSFDGFNAPVGIEDYKPEKADNVKIYPNPANDYFVLDFSNAQTVKTIQIYNINGQLINVSVIQNKFDKMFMYSAAGLHKGVYIIRVVFDDNSVCMKKLIVN